MKKFSYSLHNSSTISENALPSRPYSIFSNVPRFDLVDWKVIGFPKAQADLITVKPKLDIKVPSNVQYYGLDYFQYTNHTYPFPYNPPYIDIDNPCYVYVTNYEYRKGETLQILNFEGVDSCFYVFVNQAYVGYSSISHRHVEFDITPYLSEGDNEIRVIVFKWNFNSYLEDQDKIRLTGIFRDVYVLSRTNDYLADYDIRTNYENDYGLINFSSPKPVRLVLRDKGKIIYEEAHTNKTQIKIFNPVLWNAENPYLYELDIICSGEVIKEYVGIRHFEIIDGVLHLNKTKIKLKGMNRHSFTLNGYAETISDLERDLQIFKATNINAIRTAHYPPHPYLPFLCDKYGLYLMFESDLESHGSTMASGTYNLDDYSLVSKMDEYYAQIVARNLIGYQSVKNRPSLFSYSLGNEAGWSNALADVTDMLHKLNPSLLIHYETIFHSENKDDYYHNNLDFYSRMYADLKWCEDHLLKHKDKPLVLCEYTHSMGNSIGDAFDYQQLIEKYDHFAGGFVWEFISQSIRIGDKDLYGGDFGETQHDGNFCVDGVVEIDRTYTPQMHDLKEVFAPIGFTHKDGKLYVTNKHDFRSLLGYRYELYGVSLTEETLIKKENFSDVKAKAEVSVGPIHSNFISHKIKVYENDNLISTKEVVHKYDIPPRKGFNKPNVLIDNGLITTMNLDGVTFKNMRFHFYRPPIDNEMLYLKDYDRVGIKDARAIFQKAEENKYHFEIIAKHKVIGNIAVEYKNGEALEMHIYATFNHGLKMLQRFGVSFDVNEEEINYFGYGPYESYIDRHQGTTLGSYPLRTSDNYRYIKPQASGNHFGVYYTTVKDVLITSTKPYEVSLDNIDIYTYPSHRHLLVASTTKTLYLDYKQSGVGSYACGPELLSKYRLDEEALEFILKFNKRA